MPAGGSYLMAFLRGVFARVRRFFTGCYGGDQLSMAMTYASLVLILLGALPRLEVLLAVAYGLVLLSFIRMFSRNVKARRRENEWFLRKTAPVNAKLFQARTRLARRAAPHVTRFYQARARFKNRKTYLYFRCPGCRSWLKLPRGAGNVTVTCGRCGRETRKNA